MGAVLGKLLERVAGQTGIPVGGTAGGQFWTPPSNFVDTNGNLQGKQIGFLPGQPGGTSPFMSNPLDPNSIGNDPKNIFYPMFGERGNPLGNLFGGLGGSGGGGFNAHNPFGIEAQASLQQGMMNSMGNLAQNSANQNALAQALMAQSQGQGPNPAQAMLQNSTNQNIAQGTGMIASQKGINPGLIAQLAQRNASGLNQQAAGQGAAMNAQQQLNAQNQLGGLYGQIAGQNIQNLTGAGDIINRASLGEQGLNQQALASKNQANANILGGLGAGLGSLIGSGAFSGSDGGDAADVAEAKGGKVPGKAEVDGDSPSNDTVHALLSPGEIVLPRSVTQSKNPAEMAKQFVEHIKGQQKKSKTKNGYADVIAAHRKLGDQIKKLCSGGMT